MAYDTILQYAGPFLTFLLGVIIGGAGLALRADRFVGWLAFGYLLTGFGLGLQSFLSNSSLALGAPLTTMLYLGGAAAITHATALRCGDGWHRNAVVWAISAFCVINAARLAYLDDDLVMRMLSMNVTLGLIYLTQLPYLIGRWKDLTTLDRLLGFSTLQVGLFHFLRAVYVGQEGLFSNDPKAFVQNMTQSTHWQVLLACAFVLCV